MLVFKHNAEFSGKQHSLYLFEVDLTRCQYLFPSYEHVSLDTDRAIIEGRLACSRVIRTAKNGK